jgi:hypothetical protein
VWQGSAGDRGPYADQTRLSPSTFRIVGYSSMIRSPSSKLGLNADSVIHRGLNSLLAGQVAFRGLDGDVP